MSPPARLLGLGWDHPRCMDAVRACSAAWSRRHPEVEIAWEARSLSAFEDQPIEEIASRYDLMMIDHPSCGTVAASGLVHALDELVDESELDEIERHSVGPSFASYRYEGRLWALPVDAAAQVSAERGPTRTAARPMTWDDVLDRARAHPGEVGLPLAPAHALSSLLTLCANHGAPAAAEPGQLAATSVALRCLTLLAALAALGPEEAFGWDPPAALGALTQAPPALAYIPLSYGYSTYSTAAVEVPCRFANIPSAGLGPVGAVLGGVGLAVSSMREHAREAARFASWMARPEAQRGIVAVNSGQPSSATAWDDPELDRACGGFFRGTRATLEEAWVRPRARWWPRFQTEGGELLAAGLREQTAPERLLAELNDCYRAHRTSEPRG